MRTPWFDKPALRWPVVLSFAFTTLACVAAGAEKTDEDLTNLDLATLVNMDVIVTARKHEENVQKVPISVTALSGEQLKDRSVESLSDLQAQIPGLFVQPSGEHPQAMTLLLRGRKQNFSSLAADPSVGLYVDGFYSPRTLVLMGPLLDIDRVEVLRGPQGTLYGRNTTGGAISLFTHDPTQELSGSIEVGAGNYGAWNIVGIANAPLNDELAARFVMQRGGYDGYGHDLRGHGIGSDDDEYYRAKVRWNLSDRWQAVLAGHYESKQTVGVLFKLIGLAPASGGLPEGGYTTLETAVETGQTVPDSVDFLREWVARSKSDFYDHGGIRDSISHGRKADATLTLRGDLSDDLQFRSFTGYERLHRDLVLFAPVPVNFLTGIPITDNEYYSQELQLLGGSRSRFNWVAGAYGGYETGRDYAAFRFLPNLFGPALVVNDNRVRNSSLAAFAQGTWEFAPHWRLTGGWRYSSDKRRLDAIALRGDVCVVPAPGVESTHSGPARCPRRFQAEFQKPSWLVSLDRQMSADVFVYLKVAEGYRSGGRNQGGAVDAASFGSFAPETNLEYEAGVKSELLDRRLRLNFDGYYDEYSNLQATVGFLDSGGGLGTVVTNAATARIAGVEAEADALVAPRLRMHASATYTHANYGTFVDAVRGDRSNEPFPVPKRTWSVSGRYAWPTQLGEALLQLDYGWQSAVVLDGSAMARGTVTQSSVGLLNARVNLHLQAWGVDVALFGKNITSEEYYEQAVGVESIGILLGYAAPPATFGVQATKRFGRKSVAH